jgi:hypothetical protein
MGALSASVRADSRHSEEGNDRESRKMQFAFTLVGDMQYSAQEDTKFLNLRDSINKENVAFVLHDGDFKSSSSLYSDALYLQRFELFQTFESPFVYVFGGNDMEDCHRTAYFRIDKPLPQLAGGNPDGNRTTRLTNFTRVETFGSPDVHWIRRTVAEKNSEVFSFTSEIVDANR